MATKLTTEELEKISELQQSQTALASELGQIEIIKLNLAQRRENAEKFLTDLRTKEEEIAKEFSEKYGNGSINLQTGEFEPAPEQSLEPEAQATETVSFEG